jgi:hypothetical protein
LKAGVTYRTRYDDLTDMDLVRLLKEEATLLLEHHERGLRSERRF